MRSDKFLTLEDHRDLNGIGTGTTISTNQIDAAVARNLAAGNPLYGNLILGEDVTSGGAATINFVFVTAQNSGLTVGVRHLAESGPLALADLVMNPWSWGLGVVPDGDEEFYGLLLVVATAALTGGDLSAWLDVEPLPTQIQYPSSRNILA